MSSPNKSFTQGAVTGGLAAMAASACTHPAELLKVRLQLTGELDARQKRGGMIQNLRSMYAMEGWRGFYRGLSASMLRQALYSPARFGLFQTLMNNRTFSIVSSSSSSSSSSVLPAASMGEKLLSSLVSGAFGGILSSPADLVMVRMQADGRLAKGAQRQYSGVFGGLSAVVKESGVSGLWRGCGPNVQRAMITTATQFTSYDFFKRFCTVQVNMQEGMLLHFTASLFSSFVIASCACPMDLLRTRMMNSKRAQQQQAAASTAAASSTNAATITATHTTRSVTSHTAAVATTTTPTPATARTLVTPAVQSAYARAYTSSFDCIVQTLRTEGPLGFYKGFVPYYWRVMPQVCLMFVFYEQFNQIYEKVVVV